MAPPALHCPGLPARNPHTPTSDRSSHVEGQECSQDTRLSCASLSTLLTHKGPWGGAAARPAVPVTHHSPPLQPRSLHPQHNMPSRPWCLSRPWVTWGAVPDTLEEEMGAQHSQFPPVTQGL